MVKKIKSLLFLLIILLLVFGAFKIFGPTSEKEKTSVDIVTLLSETVNISELSTAEFVYNGIAEVYKDEKAEKLLCSIRYDSTVKASVDMSKISFSVNEETKEIIANLPQIKLGVYLLDDVPLQFIPEGTDIGIQKAREICEADVEKEALASEELYELAEENLKHTVEALLTPVLRDREYTMKWEEQKDV